MTTEHMTKAINGVGGFEVGHSAITNHRLLIQRPTDSEEVHWMANSLIKLADWARSDALGPDVLERFLEQR